MMNKKYISGVIFIILAVILFVAPFGILFAMRYDEWVSEADGISIAMSVIVGGIYLFVVMKGALKRVEPLVSMFISSIIMLVVVLMLDSIIQDLWLIFLSVSIGLLLFIIFYKIGARKIELAKVYGNEGMRIKARQDNDSLNAI